MEELRQQKARLFELFEKKYNIMIYTSLDLLTDEVQSRNDTLFALPYFDENDFVIFITKCNNPRDSLLFCVDIAKLNNIEECVDTLYSFCIQNKFINENNQYILK